MNKHYEELRALVYRELYPDGIPLEFGCEVVTKCVISKINKDKIKKLKKQYGKCLLIKDFYDMPESEEKIEFRDLVITRKDMSTSARVISDKPDIFNGSRVKQKGYGEITAYQRENTCGERINETHRNILFEDMTFHKGYEITTILGKPLELRHVLSVLGGYEQHVRNISFSTEALSFEDIRTGILIQADLNHPLSHETNEQFCKEVIKLIK